MMIEIEGLWKRFGRFDAVRGLDLSVPEGAAFALIAANTTWSKIDWPGWSEKPGSVMSVLVRLGH